ncbi:MAG: hypothetical protein WA624_23815 [Methylocella sp.]
MLLRPARFARRNLRLPSLLAPFALFFFPSGRKALGTSARPGEIALVLQEQIEQLFRRARLGQRRAIELQSLGAGNRVFETRPRNRMNERRFLLFVEAFVAPV